MIRFKKQDTILQLIQSCVKKYDQNIAFKSNTYCITYQQMYNDIIKLAQYLSRYKRKYILLNSKDKYKYAISLLAVIISDNIALLHDTSKDLEECFSKIHISCSLNQQMIDSILISKEVIYFDKAIDNNNVSDNNNASIVLCSSGTTSKPKGIVLSQKNICSTVISGLNNFQFREKEVYLSIIPYHHSFGIAADLIAILYSGGTIIPVQNVLEFYKLLPKYNPHCLNVPPIIVDGLLCLLSKSNNHQRIIGTRLTRILCSGASISENTIYKMRKYGINVYLAYGLTEASPCVSIPVDNNYVKGSSGKINDCNKVKISNEGEILVKGDNIMLGYLNDDELTKQKIKDGWLYTGDIGQIIDDHLFVKGRKDNLFVFSDGTKVIPEVIEKIIEDNEFVDEALLIKDIYEIVSLIIVSQSDKDFSSLIKSINSENLYNHPITKFTVSKTPLKRNANGKKIREI